MTTSLDRPAPRASRRASSLGRLPGLALLGDGPAPSRPAFAWLSTAVNAWILTGLFVDGWFHIHDPDLESFFTPWHAVLYSGVAAAVVLLLREVRRTGRVPDGYLPSVVGGLVVGVAGFVDGVWHETLGVEADLAALLSPPHLLLIVAGTLVFAGPLRAALRSGEGGDRRPELDLPAALSGAAVVTGLAFFTQYANPFTQLYPTSAGPGLGEPAGTLVPDPALLELREVAGVAGVVVLAVLMGGLLALLRARTSLPGGALALAVAVPPLALTTQRSTFLFVPGIVLAALLVEAVGRRLSPAALGALTGAALSTAWVACLLANEDVVWGSELLGGSVGSAAAAGFLAGWLVQQREPAGARPA